MKNKFLILIWFQIISFQVYSQSVNSKKWAADLEYYQSMLEKNHIDLYHSISKTDFQKELQSIHSNLDDKSDLDVIIDLMRLTGKIGDGHTSVSLRGIKTQVFPLEIQNFSGEWRIIKTTSSNKNLLGKILTKIDGKTIEHIFEEVKEIAQYIENTQSEVIRTANYIMISELLLILTI